MYIKCSEYLELGKQGIVSEGWGGGAKGARREGEGDSLEVNSIAYRAVQFTCCLVRVMSYGGVVTLHRGMRGP